jgi:pyruvate dehydrogenase E2 component (dihydrolipoamide acetyltransferase)
MAAQTQRHTLGVAGHSIAYSASGSGDGTIVCVHGFGSDRTVWSFNVPALTAGRIVYALDLPGHGESQPGLDSGSLDELVTIVAGFVDRLGLSRVHLIGHSLGGAIALRLAADRPALAVGLTLVAPAGVGAPVDGRFLDDFLGMPSPEAAQHVLSRLVAKPSLISTDMAAGVWHHNQQSGVAETLSAIADNAVRRDLADGALRQTLLSLDVPVEVIWGRDDAIIPATSADGLPDRIPVHRVDGAGHLVQMEKSPIVNRVMAAQAARLG